VALSSVRFEAPGDTTQSQTLSVGEAAKILGVGETKLYELAKTTGEVVPALPILRIGTRTRIPRQRLIAYARGGWLPERPESVQAGDQSR
jgi:excisionase family DNA binding protein